MELRAEGKGREGCSAVNATKGGAARSVAFMHCTTLEEGCPF